MYKGIKMTLFLGLWVLLNIYLKQTKKKKYTWVQVFKPVIIGYPILITIGFLSGMMAMKVLQTM